MSETPVCFFNGVFDVCLPRRPYPGLRPFEKEEWPIFFGRERMADAVVAQLIDKRLLVVHGDSGCGKSSLVRAAVLPRLEQESARSGLTWRTCTTLPGDAPLWNFATALAALDGGDEARAMEIRRALNFGRDAPAEIARLMRRDPKDHLCILVDQFEELFDFARRNGADEAQALVDFLIALFESPPQGLYAVLTMRSEFLGACARFRGFAETVNATQYLLPRMTHEDLLRAIREPALLFEGEISAELAEQLIHDAAGGQDQLPLIQHGLMLLYRDRVEPAPESSDSPIWRLGIEAYDRSKGLAGLLSEHADAVMAIAQGRLADNSADNSDNNTQNSAHNRVVEDMFRALTDINADGHAIRRPQTLTTLAAVAGCTEEQLRLVIDPFRVDGVSLLRPLGVEPLAADERIDISHEALIRSWQRLADPADGWLVREFRNGLVWRALLVQADSFDRDPTNVLGPTTTEERLQWMKRRNPAWAERYGGGWERVQRLLAESAKARDRDLAEQEAALRMEELAHQRAQRMRTLYRSMAIMGLLMTVTVTMSVVAWRDRQFAQEQLGIAQSARNRETELRTDAEKLLAQAQKTIGALGLVQAKLGKAAAETTNVELAQTLYQAQGTINKQVENLNQRATFGSKSPANSAKPATMTLYIHIADERQRPQAERFARLLAETDMGGSAPWVPGIELVKSSPSRSELRCFQVEECRDPGERLTKVVNSLLATPSLALKDLSGRYGSADHVQPRQFELWFAAEEIQLR